jgi:EAL domain-containing protein (putative c-di-GMP-specific phosphodiesterase class I)
VSVPKGQFLSVNMSPATLRGPTFRNAIADVDVKRIVVEVTEHMPVEDYDALNDALDGVRELGACVAIDDAGAGFASLRHILRLAPDSVKLDRSLIDGIERRAQLRGLRDLGVTCGQGFLLARPAALPDARHRLSPQARSARGRLTNTLSSADCKPVATAPISTALSPRLEISTRGG